VQMDGSRHAVMIASHKHWPARLFGGTAIASFLIE